MDGDEAASHRSSFKKVESLEDELIFHDARDRVHQETATAPSVDRSDAKSGGDGGGGSQSKSELMPRYRRVYFPDSYTPPRYSVGVQTIPQETLRQLEPSQRRAVATVGPAPLAASSVSHDDDRFFDAREDASDHGDGTENLMVHGERQANNGGCTSGRSRSPCQGGDGCGEGSDTARRWHGTAGASRTNPTRDETCCQLLLTVLYWLAVCLLLSLLLSLFMLIFLLFSRNHGLGIGPSLLYADVDVIRSHINPYLDLHHNGPPPT